jgi:hypothetical protein
MHINFDATIVAPSTGGTTTFFPLDDYLVEITAQEVKSAKDNPKNQFLELTLTVLDGSYKGCAQKTRFNMVNESAAAVQIARAELSSLCHSIGHLRLATTEELIGKRCVAEIGPQQGSDKYSEVKRWKNTQLQVNGAGNPQPALKITQASDTASAAWSGVSAPSPTTTAPTMPPPSTAWATPSAPQPAQPAAPSAWGTPAPMQPTGGIAAPAWTK